MGSLILVGYILVLLLTTHCCHGRLHQGSSFCHSYDHAKCPSCQKKYEDCSNMTDDSGNSFDVPHSYMTCFTTWRYNSKYELELANQGCWLNSDSCKNKAHCVAKEPLSSFFFCCCDGDWCNGNFSHHPEFTSSDHKLLGGNASNYLSDTVGIEPSTAVRRGSGSELSKTVIYSVVPITALAILLVTIYFMWRRHQHHLGRHHQIPLADPGLMNMVAPSKESLSIQLLEHRAKGRFGSVWKAKLQDDQLVAVKIFPMADKKSFAAEVDIYKQSNMRHENILQFMGTDMREENGFTEYFLLTEYHERGSLHDFLKANTITWAQLCRIGETMTCGLAYLHDEIPATYNSAMKPAIAHRDFKSKNVLIKSDLSACIADFGLALAFYPDSGVNETHTQVGTRRYMAPEVLEGAICFNRDSFLRIDMYACSLVLWELMTRCTCVEDVVDDYRLPFEAEVGLQPSLEEMQPLVAGQKRRPAIKPAWYQSQGMTSLVATIEECWDQDADARLSAGCVNERIADLSNTINTGGDSNAPLDTTPPPFYYGHQITPPPQAPHHLLQYNINPPELNNRLASINNNNNDNQQQQLQQQQQQQRHHQYLNGPPPSYLQHHQVPTPPPVYMPHNHININHHNTHNYNNTDNNMRNSHRVDSVSDSSNTVNDSNNYTQLSPPSGVIMTTMSSDLSSC